MPLTPELRAIEVTPGMFQTAQHLAAWRAGEPLRTRRRARWRVPERWRESVMRHCQWRCTRCGSKDSPTLEHIIPVALGGSNEPSNLTVFCPPCQRWSWARFRDVIKAAA